MVNHGILDELTWHRLLQRAKFRAPSKGFNSIVSNFSDWVFELHHDGNYKNDRTSLILGKACEKALQNNRKENRQRISNSYPLNSDWELLFQDPLNFRPTPFTISALKINGIPLQGVPDMVWRNRITGEILIKEIKTTKFKTNIDNKIWPNVWSQLWCYSYIDKWVQAPEVFLVGDIYRAKMHKTEKSDEHTSDCLEIKRGGAFQLLRSNEMLNYYNKELFKLFSDHVQILKKTG